MFTALRDSAFPRKTGSRSRVASVRRPALESLEERRLLSTLVIPAGNSPDLSATFNVTESGSTFPTDQSISGGNYLAALDGTPLTATYSVNLSLASLSFIPGPFNGASVSNDATIYGVTVPDAGAISWLLTNLGPGAVSQVQQDALQAAIWRTEYGSTFQLDGVDNSNAESPINSMIASTYQADLAALGSHTAPVSSVSWITPGTSLGQSGQGLVALEPTVSPLPTPTPPTATGTLVLPQTNVPGIEVTYVSAQSDGTAFINTNNVAGGNFLGTFNNTPLAASYCLNLSLGLDVPETFNTATATSTGTVYGTTVPNAGAISWLLTNLGPGATTAVQQDALQAAIWREEYGRGYEFAGSYDFQLDGVDNTLDQDNDAAVEQAYQADIAALGNNTAPVGNVLWISSDGNVGLAQAQDQALVGLPATPTPTPTPSPTATATLVLPNTTIAEFSATYNGQSGQDVSGGNFLGTLGGTPLTATYCVSFTLQIGVPDTFPDAAVSSSGTIYGAAVPNAGAISWLVSNLGPGATTAVEQDALQAAIWRAEYGNSFQLDGVDNGDTADELPFNSMIASTYQADLAALGNNTAPASNVLWISPGNGSQTGLMHVQGLVATTATAPGGGTGTPSPTPAPTPPQVASIAVAAHSKKGLTGFAVVFNEPLTQASATNRSLYRVLEGVKKVVKRHRQTVFTKSLAIRSVSLNGAGTTVTITLAKPFKGTVQVAATGTVTAANGASNSIKSTQVL